MNKLQILILAAILALVQHASAQSAVPLTLKSKIAKDIANGSKETYTITMKTNQFALIRVFQDGVDLIVRTFDPAGKELEIFDSPNGRHGPEMVMMSSAAAGAYRIEVSPLDPAEPPGKYSIELLRQESKGTTPQQQADQLMSVLVLPDMPGATIAVAKGDQILFSKGYGLSNPEYNIANTPKTIFHIASVSKQFTAFAIAMLADQGKISLDDDIRKHIPELPDFGEKITIRHLVFHSSGLRDQWNLLALAGWRLDDVITRDQVLRLMSLQKDLNFKPGAEFNYCNTGYTLMAEIVARVSGKTFAEWTQENIFKPLGMTNTLFYDDHERIVPNRAYSFYDAQGGLRKSGLAYANVGATSLFTTAEDLVKWSNNFQVMKVGNGRIMKQMEERGILNAGDTLTYAFGQGIGQYKGLKTREHGGADAGYRSFLLRFPDQRFTIAVLSNLASFNTAAAAYKLADIFLKDQLREEKKPEPVKSDVVQVSEELLKLYSGDYELQPGLIVNMRLENGKLVAQATGQPSVTLVAKNETEFMIASINAEVSFMRTGPEVNEFILNQNGNKITAKRVKQKTEEEKPVLKNYEGVYYSPELETQYTLAIEGDHLIAKHLRHGPSKLMPVSPKLFNCEAWFMSRIEFELSDKGEVTGMLVSSGRVRNVRFTKIKQPVTAQR